MKRIVTIQDISCVGKCSLTVALPIISAMGVETAIIPTAVLSTHTMFKNFTVKDLTDQIEPITNHWKNEEIGFDALYTGYLGSFEQIDLMKKMFEEFKTDSNITFVDPAMGDHGKLYPAFDEAFAKADDYFANLSRDTEGADELLLNYDDAYDIGITTEKDGYTFKIDKIVSGQRKCNKVINGSIFDGTAEFQWCVEEGYYLITEVTRTDGKNLTEEDKNIWFDMSVVVAGFNPTSTQGSLRGGYGIGDVEEDRWCMVTEVTNAMMFAGYDLGLVIIGNQDIGGIVYDEVYLDENGLPAFRDNVEGTNLVMKFNIDEKFADDKAAKAYAEEYGWNIGLDLYKK